MSFIIWAIILLIVVGLIVLFTRVMGTVNHFGDIIKMLIKSHQVETEEKPKSLSSATSIYLPQIEKDFPEFNYFEFKNIAKNTLISTFLVLDTQDITKLVQCSHRFRETIALELEDHKNSNILNHYEQISIYQTEISNYIKKDGRCVITLQSAVGYCHWIEKDGKLLEGNKTVKKQTRYYTQLVYVQDVDMTRDDHDDYIGNNCPNCGGAITNLGAKACEYCGTGLVTINIKVWSIDNYEEVGR